MSSLDNQIDILIQRFWDEIQRYFGLQSNTNKNSMIFDLVAERMHRHGITSPEEYLEKFATSEYDADEYDYWASHLTVNETYFYRNTGDWEALLTHILPELIERNSADRTLRIATLGASSGEEPYTLSMLLRQNFPDLKRWNVEIVATDIHIPLITKAKRGGPYSNRSVQSVPEELKNEFMYLDDKGWFVEQEIRDSVTYSYANLFNLPKEFEKNSFDLIVCRNVVIYFEQEAASDIVGTIFKLLKLGGFLVLGHSEGTIADMAGLPSYHLAGCLAYKRIAENVRKKNKNGEADPATYLATASFGKPDNVEKMQSWESTEQLVARAKQLIDEGDLEKAMKELNSVLMREPFHARAHYYMGIIHQNLGELGKALNEFEKVTRLDPDYMMGFFQAAMLCQRVRNYSHAKNYYTALNNMLNQLEPDEILEGSEDVTAGFARIICQRFLTNHSM